MRWPGKIPAGSINKEITGIIDMLPTFCALSGAELPSDRIIDGKNILPYLMGEKVASPIHKTFIVPGVTIRHGDWKLLVKRQTPGGNGNKGLQGRKPAEAGSLFNLKDDIGETNDLSSKHPEIVQQLQAAHERLHKGIRVQQAPRRLGGRLFQRALPRGKAEIKGSQSRRKEVEGGEETSA